jgi:hypothetical protein
MNILRLHPDGGAPPIVIELSLVRVGRDSASDVHLKDASVSRQHAEIEKRGDDWVILDQNSGNGIRVDGQRTHEAVLLPGQQLHIGNLRFRVEIDRGDDGATMMIGRSPLLESGTDRTLLANGPPVFPKSEPVRRPFVLPVALTVGALVGVVLALVAYRAIQRNKTPVSVAARAPTPLPLPVATLPPEPVPTPTATPLPRPMGSLLVSVDVDSQVLIDGRVVAQLKAAGIRRFTVTPGEHIVAFRSALDGTRTEVVARVRVNEQTVVRREGSSQANPGPPPAPTASTDPIRF